MTNNGFEKAQMDPGTVYRLMMQARQARSDSIHYWAVVFFNNIAFGAASLSAALRSVFAKRTLEPRGAARLIRPHVKFFVPREHPMRMVSKYDLTHYPPGQLVSCAVIGSGWVLFYLVLFLHGLTSSNHGLQTAKDGEANRPNQIAYYGSTTTSADPFE